MSYQRFPNEPDQKIAAALHHAAEGVEVSPWAEARLMANIKALDSGAGGGSRREKPFFKRFSRRFITAFCVIFCLTCVTALAATGIAGWSGGTVVGSMTQKYADVAGKLAPQLDYTPKTVESFKNGFTFTDAALVKNQAHDEQLNGIGKVYTEISLFYTDPQTAERLSLYVNDIPAEIQNNDNDISAKNVKTVTVDGVTLRYAEYKYKMVTADYELTEEDRAALASGELEISSGSTAYEERYLKSVYWRQDGLAYSILGWDLSLSDEDMLNMAQEVMAVE